MESDKLLQGPDKQKKEKTRKCFERYIPDRVSIMRGGRISPKYKNSNKIDNRKYGIITFIPMIMYNQFKFFFNLYFLILCITQLFDAFKVGFLVTYIGPLAMVLGLTMLKELSDDISRFQRDKKYNNETFSCIAQDGSGRELLKKSRNIKVGDILYLKKGDRVPCDLIILATKAGTNGSVYIKTDQLDGETDWKMRNSINLIQNEVNDGVGIGDIDFQIDIGKPTDQIYEFRGGAKVGVKNSMNNSSDEDFSTDRSRIKEDVEPLNLNYTAWSSTTVASGEFYGLVIYVGKDTRIQMNSNSPRIKFPRADFEINYLSKLLFLFCVGLAFMFVCFDSFRGAWHVKLVQFLVLLCCIIPQSLRTNLDLSKLMYSYRINHDKQIDGTVCRNSQICEELGRVQYLLSDKTGTLTKNEMIFKTLATKALNYTEEDFDYIKKLLPQINPLDLESITNKKQRDLSLLMLCVGICNTIQPCFDDKGERFLQSSSPDEIALVTFAEEMGYFIKERDRNTIRVVTPFKEEVIFNFLKVFPFSSAKKRMGVIVQEKISKKIYFFLKGADTAIKKKVNKNGDMIVEEADNLARDGLRTLAFCYRMVEQAEYNKWNKEYNDAIMQGEEKYIDDVLSILESNMTYLGLSGVEDLLQDQVRETIESLREARIKIWILTGDKVETAKCIAKSTGLKAKNEIFYEMNTLDQVEIENQVNKLMSKHNTCLVVQGSVVAKIYQMKFEKLFFNAIKQFPAVVFCRCSPTQKAVIAKSLQQFVKASVCSIGDGGNDVSMIQQANVGIGIEGKEGLQAAMCSDFSIKQFKNVKRLLLWHGRRASLSTAKLTLFVMHRGIIIALIQVLFSLTFYGVTVAVYNPFLVIGYAMIYLMLPVFSFATAEDITQYHAMNYPVLYIVCQSGKQLNTASFAAMIWKSIFQAAVIFVFSIKAFNSMFLDIVTVSYSTLVLVELLNIFLMVPRPNFCISFTVLISLVFFLISVFWLKGFLGIIPITLEMWCKIGIITLICWGPFRFASFIKKRFFPSVSDKIMKIAVGDGKLNFGESDPFNDNFTDDRELNFTHQGPQEDEIKSELTNELNQL